MVRRSLLAFAAALLVAATFTVPSPAATKGDPAKGKEKFNLMCASCHGTEGKGDGPAGAALTPKPRDLTDAAYMSSLDDEHLVKVIKEGGAAVGKSPLMPPLGGALTDEDVHNIVAFIRAELCKCQFKQ